jgi:uncharacterized protein YyaL (SSP411 family)
MVIEFLLQIATRGNSGALNIAKHALHAMARGGMYDLVGGGFHRYSTDNEWLVPHFEKMLYDNAQLALVYLHAYLITGDEAFRQIVEETLDFVQRELLDSSGGFYSSIDADSEGQEGRFYLWSDDELQSQLGDSSIARVFFATFEITPSGNFEGLNILQKKAPEIEVAQTLSLSLNEYRRQLRATLDTLYHAREGRARPGPDDKVIVFWNALAIRAFSEAGRYLDRPDYLAAARANAKFLLQELHPADRLLRSWRNGTARHNGYLEDYASLILGLLSLYQSDPDPAWFSAAVQLSTEMLANFSDPAGGFFNTRSDHETLLLRPKEIQDNATPSGNALAASALLWLNAYTGDDRGENTIKAAFSLVRNLIAKYPTSFAFWLQGLDFWLGPITQIAVLTPQSSKIQTDYLDEIMRDYHPRNVLAVSEGPPPEIAPALLKDRPILDNRTTVYVCRNFVCDLPVTTLDGVKKAMKSAWLDNAVDGKTI